MPHPFDPGYSKEPFRTLCADYPGPPVYSPADFRTEWGPVFHRGRLDGTARVLVIGQDPAQHETIARRCLIGEAGHRVQGLLARLGIDRSYVIVNTFLYSVYGQGGGTKNKNNPGIVDYRNRWLDALLGAGSRIRAVIALGTLADLAWQQWKATPAAAGIDPTYAKVTHPTQPESSSKGDRVKLAAATKAMLKTWNAALQTVHPSIASPDVARPLKLYGATIEPADLPDIPECDLEPGSPSWMLGAANWAKRTGTTPAQKRATIVVTVPRAFRI
jgi:hypothetical protein